MTVGGDEASEALVGMREARVRANEMKRLPFAYHLGVGALTGGLVLLSSLPRWWFGIGLLAFLAGTWAMNRWQMQATSRWINGFRYGRTLWVAALMLIVIIGLVLASNEKMMPSFALFTPLQGALIAFVAVTFLDWLWVKAYDAEMRSGR
jgi:uncharacterized membrane protein